MIRLPLAVLLLTTALGCSRLDDVGETPEFTPTTNTLEHQAMARAAPPPEYVAPDDGNRAASLWSADRRSLYGDRRADQPGDILTVVIEIDDNASIDNSSSRSRQASQELGMPDLFGLPQRIEEKLPVDLGSAVGIESSSSASGDGSVSRNEQLELKVAATVIDVLGNGVLRIQGSQEVRVNFEIRELLVTGYVRPEDISRQNEITYDKIASARISYGGRGQITDVQQPRYGQQAAERLLPF